MLKNLAYKHRWIKRIFYNFLPDIDFIYLPDKKMKLAFSAKDLTGPSFHLSYGQEVGFQNYEEQDKDYIVEYLKTHPGLFIDIGANIGLMSFYILYKIPDQEILAFEPEPQAFECLQLSKAANSFNSFTPIRYAIAEKKEEIHFFIDKKNFGGHRNYRSNPNEECITVAAAPLNEFITSQKISAVKIDVEGAELNVLKGMKDIIESHKPLLVVECSNEELAKKGHLYQYFLNFKDVSIFHLHLDKFVSLAEISNFAMKEHEKKIQLHNYFFKFS